MLWQAYRYFSPFSLRYSSLSELFKSKPCDPYSFLSLRASTPLSHPFKSMCNMDSQSQTRHCLLPADIYLYTQKTRNATLSALYRRAASTCPSRWSSCSPGKRSPSPFPGFPLGSTLKWLVRTGAQAREALLPLRRRKSKWDRQQSSWCDTPLAMLLADKLTSCLGFLDQVFWVCFFWVGTLFREDPDKRTEAAVYLFQLRSHLKFTKLPLAH